jgi:hypothetical protein
MTTKRLLSWAVATFTAFGLASAAILTAGSARVANAAPVAAESPSPAPEIPPGPPLPLPLAPEVPGALPTTLPIPAPVYLAAGRHVVSQDRALALARTVAQGPVTREAAAPMLYRDWVAWRGGARTYSVDLDREVYLVVLSARYEPQGGVIQEAACGWIGVLLDGVEGFLHSVSCGQGSWPTALPPQFSGR